jgi:hypothetical protein
MVTSGFVEFEAPAYGEFPANYLNSRPWSYGRDDSAVEGARSPHGR